MNDRVYLIFVAMNLDLVIYIDILFLCKKRKDHF